MLMLPVGMVMLMATVDVYGLLVASLRLGYPVPAAHVETKQSILVFAGPGTSGRLDSRGFAVDEQGAGGTQAQHAGALQFRASLARADLSHWGPGSGRIAEEGLVNSRSRRLSGCLQMQCWKMSRGSAQTSIWPLESFEEEGTSKRHAVCQPLSEVVILPWHSEELLRNQSALGYVNHVMCLALVRWLLDQAATEANTISSSHLAGPGRSASAWHSFSERIWWQNCARAGTESLLA